VTARDTSAEARSWVDVHASHRSVGVDAERVDRWRSADTRLFTDAENAHCRAQGRPEESYAGRWAAKEAVVKAVFPFCVVGPRDVEVVAGADGAPRVRLRLPSWAADLVEVVVSISHTSHMAVAVAVADLRRGAPPANEPRTDQES